MRHLCSFSGARASVRLVVLAGLVLASLCVTLRGQGPPVLVAAGPHEEYYLLMFGSQRVPADPRYSHSFAEFVKVTDCGSGPPVLCHHQVSWLPQSLDIRLFTLFPEPGVNLGLHATL